MTNPVERRHQRRLFYHPNQESGSEVEVTPAEFAARLRTIQEQRLNAATVPPPPENETRSVSILLRLSPSERKSINAAAAAENLSQQAYLLKKLLG